MTKKIVAGITKLEEAEEALDEIRLLGNQIRGGHDFFDEVKDAAKKLESINEYFEEINVPFISASKGLLEVINDFIEYAKEERVSSFGCIIFDFCNRFEYDIQVAKEEYDFV